MLNKTLPTILKGFTKTIGELEAFADKKQQEIEQGVVKISKLNDEINSVHEINLNKQAEGDQAIRVSNSIKALLGETSGE